MKSPASLRSDRVATFPGLGGRFHRNTHYDRNIPLPTVKDALLLASARRVLRSQDAHPLAPVRSLCYFLPVIEELLETPLPKGYSRYLQRKIAAFSTHCRQDSRSKDLRPDPGASSETRTFS